MAITPVAIIPGLTLGTTTTVLYTCPGSTKARVGNVVFTNTGAGNVTFNVSVTRAGGTSRLLISGQALSAGQAYVSPELFGLVLEAGDAFAAQASVAGGVNVVGSGVQL